MFLQINCCRLVCSSHKSMQTNIFVEFLQPWARTRWEVLRFSSASITIVINFNRCEVLGFASSPYLPKCNQLGLLLTYQHQVHKVHRLGSTARIKKRLEVTCSGCKLMPSGQKLCYTKLLKV